MTRALVAAFAALLVAGCGGEAVPAQSEPLTRAEWIARADAICAEANARIQALGEPENAQELASLAGEFADVNDEADNSLRLLAPPAEIQSQVERALELTERQIDILREISDAAADRNQESTERLVEELAPLEREADQIAAAIGLETCGRDG